MRKTVERQMCKKEQGTNIIQKGIEFEGSKKGKKNAVKAKWKLLTSKEWF